MIYGTDEFRFDQSGKKWQRCYCDAEWVGLQHDPQWPRVIVWADEGNSYRVENEETYPGRMVGTGKDLTFRFFLPGVIEIADEKELTK